MTAGWEWHREYLAETIPHGSPPFGIFQVDLNLGPTENLRRIVWRMNGTFGFAGGEDTAAMMWPVGGCYAQVTVGDQGGNYEVVYRNYRPYIVDVFRVDLDLVAPNFYFSGHIAEVEVDLQISRSFTAYGGAGLQVSVAWEHQLYPPNFVATMHPQVESRGELAVLGRHVAP